MLEQPKPVTFRALPLIGSIETDRRPLLISVVLLQTYPDAPTHRLLIVLFEKIPKDSNPTTTTATIIIAQPYVTRYSIDDCAFPLWRLLERCLAGLVSCICS